MDATPPSKILINPLGWEFLNPPAVYRTVGDVISTDAIDVLKELANLRKLPEDYNGYSPRASRYAYKNARKYLISASYVMPLAPPEIASDGDKGIDIEWGHQGRKLALSCRGTDADKDFLSWREAEGRYEGDIATQSLLNTKLDWLMS